MVPTGAPNTGTSNSNKKVEKKGSPNANENVEKIAPPFNNTGPPIANQKLEQAGSGRPDATVTAEKVDPSFKNAGPPIANVKVEKQGTNVMYMQNRVFNTQSNQMIPPYNYFNSPPQYNGAQRFPPRNFPGFPYQPHQQQSPACFCHQLGMMQPVSVNVQTTYVPQNVPIYPQYQSYQQNFVNHRLATINNIPSLPNQPKSPVPYKFNKEDVGQQPLTEPVPVLYKFNKEDAGQLTESTSVVYNEEQRSTREVLASFAKLLSQVLKPATPKIQGKESPTSQQSSTKDILVNFAKLMKEVEENRESRKPQQNKTAVEIEYHTRAPYQKPRQEEGLNQAASSKQLKCRKPRENNAATGEEVIGFEDGPTLKESTVKEVEVLVSFAKLLSGEEHDEVESKEVLASFAELLETILKEESAPENTVTSESKCSDLLKEEELLEVPPITDLSQDFEGSTPKSNKRNALIMEEEINEELASLYVPIKASPQELQENAFTSKTRSALLLIKPKARSDEERSIRTFLLSQDQLERKVYHPDFLLALKKSPKSNEKPTGIPDAILVDPNREIKKVSKSKEEVEFPMSREENKGSTSYNRRGKIVYNREFLMSFKNRSENKRKPGNILNVLTGDPEKSHNREEGKIYNRNHPETKETSVNIPDEVLTNPIDQRGNRDLKQYPETNEECVLS